MAKKKLTSENVLRLAERLCGTQQNVYRVCESMFRFTPGEEIFDLLESTKGPDGDGLFKCENCDEWKPTCDKDRDIQGFCASCVDEECLDEEGEEE